jgi:hypothetical protein
MMHPLLVDIACLPDLKLLAKYNNGKSRVYDMNALINTHPVFAPLKYVPGLFQKARVDTGGHGVVWNSELDLAAEEMWEHGEHSTKSTNPVD